MADVTHKPTPIFRAPTGLQDFLGTKAVGINPDRLSEMVQPDLSLYPFYLAQIPVQVISITGIAPASLGQDIEMARVPAGQIWLLQSFRVEVGDQTAATLTAGECYVAPPGGTIVFTSPQQYVTNLATNPTTTLCVSSYEWGMAPLVCPTDFSFGVTFTRFGVAGATANFRMAFRSLLV
jgi:hypothetical protein